MQLASLLSEEWRISWLICTIQTGSSDLLLSASTAMEHIQDWVESEAQYALLPNNLMHTTTSVKSKSHED